MSDDFPGRLIADTIPQLFRNQVGPARLRIQLPGSEQEYSLLREPSPELQTYVRDCERIIAHVLPAVGTSLNHSIERQWLQQKFAVAWLEARTTIRCWEGVIDHVRRLRERTLENEPITKTLVIDPSVRAEGAPALPTESYSKVFDWLGSSPLTFLRVDENLRVAGLEALSMSDVTDHGGYRFYPDFLNPVIHRIRGTKGVIAHLDAEGDLLIADADGILAILRRGRWKIFDADHLIATVAHVLDRKVLRQETPGDDPTCVACSLLQILFDMSFRRHGGLLVIDAVESFRRYVTQGIRRGGDSPLDRIFTRGAFNGLEFTIPETRKLVELSCIDGALVLDPVGNLLETGSMILPVPDAPVAFGARDTAAYSAARRGAAAFKVSADGQASFFFTMKELGDEEVRRLDLL